MPEQRILRFIRMPLCGLMNRKDKCGRCAATAFREAKSSDRGCTMFEKYVDMAKEFGAVNAVEFAIKDIVFDPRTVLLCVFGCTDYGKNHTCPHQRSPLSLKEYKKIFKRYSGGIIIGSSDKLDSQQISYEIERRCFLDGHYFAFSLSEKAK